jgi:hypothetical protein
MPEDVIEILETVYQDLRQGQFDGQEIHPDENGLPVLQDPIPFSGELTLSKLKKLLRDTDYQALPDYQATKTLEENEANLQKRAEWRALIRDQSPPVET